MIEVLTLGGASIRTDGSEDAKLSAHRQKIALLALLGIEGSVARDRLLGTFWPEREEDKARHALSQALYALKKDLHEDCVHVVGDTIALGAGAVVVDAKELEEASSAGQWEKVVELYRGPFLEQFHIPEAPEFEEWLSCTRVRLSRMAARAFAKVAEARTAAGDLKAALEIAWRWATLDPLDDEAQHALIALLAQTGDRSGALQQYALYRERLARELEVEPLAETIALIEKIRAGAPLETGRLTEAAEAPAPATVQPSAEPARATANARNAVAAVEPERLEQVLRDELEPRLQIQRLLGHGSMSSVYLAREPALRRLVAVKVFSPKLARDRRSLLRFEREAQATACLSHPNIVSLHWLGRLSCGLPYIVMQYVKGRTLADRLEAHGALDVEEATRVVIELASALYAAHRKGIVHRDIRPANVLHEEETGRHLLTDFGFARILASGDVEPTRITETGELVGNPRYTSPEQLRGEKATELSDVYSLGILAFEILTGELPYEADSRRELFAAHLKGKPKKLSELRKGVDPQLEALIEHCLAKKPEHRPTPADVERTLSALAERPAPRRRGILSAILGRRRRG